MQNTPDSVEPVLLGSHSTSTLEKKKPKMMEGRPSDKDDVDEEVAEEESSDDGTGAVEKKSD